MKRVLVLASGRGSNFRSLIESTKHGVLRSEIVGLGVSRRDCGAIQVGEAAGLPILVVPSETEILEFSTRERIDAIALAGYMRILSPGFIESFRGPNGLSRIVNVHPSLLPAFPGRGAYERAFSAGVRETGVTVHLVEKDVDSGPILDQKSFRIDRLRSAEEVESLGLPVEHELYPRTLDWFVNGEYRVETRGGKPYVARA